MSESDQEREEEVVELTTNQNIQRPEVRDIPGHELATELPDWMLPRPRHPRAF